ncbi:M56 family metallopeptidase [Chryseobacterium sp.]|uniref:M56 family metallopeptidase n=1 Tax=Chryseobacterium sp. TaxID=1871047 RepID=UPI001E4C9EBA|nr:M56 family metallopeptidase [Chryseobacterium sp.]
MIRLTAGILKIYWIRKTYPVENFEGIKFYQTDLQNAPFSFFRNLFWKISIPISSDLGRQILKHEMVHMEQRHSWDKMFMEVVTAVFWVNPVFFVISKELSLIHEYLADKKALKNSDTKAFAQMLLASHFSGNHLPATSPFLSSNLKKRLIMLKKSKTKFGYARKILALPILFLLTFAYMVNAKNKEIAEVNMLITQRGETMKKDTIKPQSSQQLKPDSQKTDIKSSQKPGSPNKKTMEISERLQTKSRELQELAEKKDFNNPRLQELGKEISELSSRLDDLLKSEPEQGSLDRSLVELEKLMNSESFALKLKEAEMKSGEVAKMLNSPEFKARLREVEERAEELRKTVNTPAFRRKLRNAEKNAEKARKLLNSPQFKERIRNAEAKEANKRTAYLQETKRFKISQDINRIYSDKEIGEMRKEAERMQIAAEKRQEEKRKSQNFKIAILKADVSSVLIYDAAGKVLSEKMLPARPVVTDLNHSKLYVNGKQVSPDEFDRFSADQLMMENKKASNIKTLTFARTGDSNKSKLDRIEITTK